jgi:hypothetical protein
LHSGVEAAEAAEVAGAAAEVAVAAAEGAVEAVEAAAVVCRGAIAASVRREHFPTTLARNVVAGLTPMDAWVNTMGLRALFGRVSVARGYFTGS